MEKYMFEQFLKHVGTSVREDIEKYTESHGRDFLDKLDVEEYSKFRNKLFNLARLRGEIGNL